MPRSLRDCLVIGVFSILLVLLLAGCAGRCRKVDTTTHAILAGRLGFVESEFSYHLFDMFDYRLLNMQTGDEMQLVSFGALMSGRDYHEEGYFFFGLEPGTYAIVKLSTTGSSCDYYSILTVNAEAGKILDLGTISVVFDEAREDESGEGGIAIGGEYVFSQAPDPYVLKRLGIEYRCSLEQFGGMVLQPELGRLDVQCGHK